MPLAFDSLSHGTIAFGFFNIETDMLLLEHYFFFATQFCTFVSHIAEIKPEAGYRCFWQVYSITDSADIGDLMGAIHGIHYKGFLGETYRRFPFPKNREDFKQQSEGFKNRVIVEEIIQKYARPKQLLVVIEEGNQVIRLGEYLFNRPSFLALIRYVWQGGYPRWKEGKRPQYVLEMKEKIITHRGSFFDGLFFEA